MKRSAWLSAILIGLLAGSIGQTAWAHIGLTNPPGRYDFDYVKDGPCGHPSNPPGTGVATVLQGGSTITVELDEYFNHTSHFRISIAGSDGEFVNPTAFDDYYNDETVVLDNIEDASGTRYHEIAFTVPNIDCDPCVMQVIQVMKDGGGFSLDDLYFQCSDIVIEADNAATSGTTTTSSTSGGDSSEGGSEDGQAGQETADASDGTSGANPTSGSPATTAGSLGSAGETDDDASADTADTGCSCSTPAERGGVTASWLVGLIVLLRRRKRGVR
jgi:hypothetical protein